MSNKAAVNHDCRHEKAVDNLGRRQIEGETGHESCLSKGLLWLLPDATADLILLNSRLESECLDVAPKEKAGEFSFHHNKIESKYPQEGKGWCKPFFRTEIAYTNLLRNISSM